MDDTKKLIERYKRELLEYSKASRAEPVRDFGFPDITEQEEIQPTAAQNAESYEESLSDTAYTEAPEETLSDDAEQMEEYSGVSTVVPELAEEIDDIPVSGSDSEEMLGNRSFESEQPVQNDPDDIRPLEQSGEVLPPPAPQEYATLEEFVAVNSRRGSVRVSVYTARGAFGVEGARVVISQQLGGKQHIFYVLTTDSSGVAPVVMLPAPPKELSETPESTQLPYAPYNLEITADGYNEVLITDMPIFEGILSQQRVALVPSLGEVPQVITESGPDLNGGA